MTNFPPIQRYWPLYAAVFLILLVILSIAYQLLASDERDERSLVLLASAAVATLAVAANSWSQWRTMSVAHALDTLQTLRTDREYLINALVLRSEVKVVGEPLPKDLADKFMDTSQPSSIEQPSFRDASLFVLNQYEFIAAGARSGAVDKQLLRETIRGAVIMLCKTFAAQIIDIRKKNPAAYSNLVWLCHSFERGKKTYLGPLY